VRPSIFLLANGKRCDGFVHINYRGRECEYDSNHVHRHIEHASLVAIDVGTGDAGFSIPNTAQGLTWNNMSFGRWLACIVTAEVIGLQLFWASKIESEKGKVEKQCDRVRLAPQYFLKIGIARSCNEYTVIGPCLEIEKWILDVMHV